MKPKVLIFISFLCLSFSVFCNTAEAASYHKHGTAVSENLLSGASDVSLITEFQATTTLPSTATMEVQFSRNGTMWYDASGNRWGTEELSDGGNSIDLTSLDWDKPYFYYKIIAKDSSTSSTPTLDSVNLEYSDTLEPTTKYHGEGTAVSKNLLSGESNVERITQFSITTDIPTDATTTVQFSQNGVKWYDATGTEWGEEVLIDGTNTIDLTDLRWNDSYFYYKLNYETASSTQTSEVSNVEVQYSDDPDDALETYYGEGVMRSSDIITDPSPGNYVSRFAYHLSDLPESSTVKAQFSCDGDTYYGADGSEWGWSELSAGDKSSREKALSVGMVNCPAESFYYKIKMESSDSFQTPKLNKVSLYYVPATQVGSPAENFLSDGLMAYWSFDGSAMDWSASGGEVEDLSGKGNHGALQNMTSKNAVTGKQGQSLSFNGSDEYIGVGTFEGMGVLEDSPYRKKINIQSSEVDADLTDFPVYVDLSTIGSDFFSKTNSGCGDVRVTESDGSTEVPREIVSCDRTAETGEMHFKAPSVSASSDTGFYIYYGSGGSDYADSDPYGAENVWDENYIMTHHLDETPAGTDGTHYDSTTNANDGTTNGNMDTDATGKLYGADNFDGSDDYIELPTGILDTSARTFSAWVKYTSDGDIYNFQNDIAHMTNVDSGNLRVWINGTWHGTGHSLDDDSFHYVTVSYDGDDSWEVFVDGSSVDSISASLNSGGGSNNVIGRDDTDQRNFQGIIDEFRVSSARSSDWISAEYKNQNSPGTFYNVGSEEQTSDVTKTKTISFWIKADDLTDRKIMDIDGTDQIEIDSNSNISATSFPDPTVYVDGSDASTEITSDWHHVVITDSTGVEASAVDLARASNEYFAGTLDQVRFYDRVLSQDEIGQLNRHGARKLQPNTSQKGTQSDGLVGHWTFDGQDIDWSNTGAEIRDVSGQENHGAVNGFGQSAATIGKQGQALSFDGEDDYVSLSEVGSSIDFAGGVTISLWFKPDFSSDINVRMLSDQEAYGNDPNLVGVTRDGNLFVKVGDKGVGLDISTFNTSHWYHIVGVMDSLGNVKGYVDGSLEGENTGGANTYNDNWTLGRNGSADVHHFNGQIDDVRIYDRALSEEEIEKLYRIGDRKFQIRQ